MGEGACSESEAYEEVPAETMIFRGVGMHGQVQKAYEEEDKERDQERCRAGDESGKAVSRLPALS